MRPDNAARVKGSRAGHDQRPKLRGRLGHGHVVLLAVPGAQGHADRFRDLQRVRLPRRMRQQDNLVLLPRLPVQEPRQLLHEGFPIQHLALERLELGQDAIGHAVGTQPIRCFVREQVHQFERLQLSFGASRLSRSFVRDGFLPGQGNIQYEDGKGASETQEKHGRQDILHNAVHSISPCEVDLSHRVGWDKAGQESHHPLAFSVPKIWSRKLPAFHAAALD